MPLLFAYGTLLDEQVQRRVFGRSVAGRPDRVGGYASTFLHIGTRQYPNMVHTDLPTDDVAGQVLDISADELRAADAYETAAYARRVVTLGSGTSAWVYIATTTST